MLDKILSIFIKNFGKKGKIISYFEEDGQLRIFFKKKIYVNNKFYYLYLDYKILLDSIITLIIFLILWKLNIEILNEDFLWEKQKNFYIFFIIYFILRRKYYLYEIFKMINLIINSLIIIFLFDLSVMCILKYNILIVLSYYMIFIINCYHILFNWSFVGDFIYNFLWYPWVIIIIIYIIMYFKRENYFKYFKYLDFLTVSIIIKDYEIEEIKDIIEGLW